MSEVFNGLIQLGAACKQKQASLGVCLWAQNIYSSLGTYTMTLISYCGIW